MRDADGTRVDEHDARVDPEDARVVLADLQELPEGSYEVQWRVTSIDGHVVEGRYVFAVAGPIGHGESGAHGDHARGAVAPRTEDRKTEHPGHEPARKQRGGQSDHEAPGPQEPAATEHGLALAATALLAGLAPFVALEWLPANRQTGACHGVLRQFGVLAWASCPRTRSAPRANP